MIIGLGGGLGGDSQGLDALSQVLASSNTPTTIDTNITSTISNNPISNQQGISYYSWLAIGIVGLFVITFVGGASRY